MIDRYHNVRMRVYSRAKSRRPIYHSLVSEVVGSHDRKIDCREKWTGPLVTDIARTRDTRNRYFAYNREAFWRESRISDIGQGNWTLLDRAYLVAEIAITPLSPIVWKLLLLRNGTRQYAIVLTTVLTGYSFANAFVIRKKVSWKSCGILHDVTYKLNLKHAPR